RSVAAARRRTRAAWVLGCAAIVGAAVALAVQAMEPTPAIAPAGRGEVARGAQAGAAPTTPLTIESEGAAADRGATTAASGAAPAAGAAADKLSASTSQVSASAPENPSAAVSANPSTFGSTAASASASAKPSAAGSASASANPSTTASLSPSPAPSANASASRDPSASPSAPAPARQAATANPYLAATPAALRHPGAPPYATATAAHATPGANARPGATTREAREQDGRDATALRADEHAGLRADQRADQRDDLRDDERDGERASDHDRPGAGRATAQATGELRINATPWGTVEIGGHRVDTPAVLALPAGTYQLKISNPELGTRRSMPVTIRAGASKRLVVDLQR
ncbi:MAG TPA: hypothetical protein VHE35_24730, partial [Kofleriaceae bacterium]|nr:hypothetical protein [Kofleriaceae bacterium]